jgi:hypothetical protein
VVGLDVSGILDTHGGICGRGRDSGVDVWRLVVGVVVVEYVLQVT